MKIGTVQSLTGTGSGIVDMSNIYLSPLLSESDFHVLYPELAQRVAELERRVARLEAQQRRGPKRKRTGGRR